jgi:hypothetical protein
VERPAIEEALARAETAVGEERSLSGTGFWPTVGVVKQNPELVAGYAERIAAIDDAAFHTWAVLILPLGVGTLLALVATAAGLGLVGLAYYLDGFAAVLVFYAGLGVVLTTTHGLGHLIVGRLLGIKFTAWFVGKWTQPQPGVKVEYESYLKTPARSRAWMHASGALVTKVMPFVFIGAAVAADLPAWAVWILPIMGVAMILTDVLWSTKSSDWKKVRREMALARSDSTNPGL